MSERPVLSRVERSRAASHDLVAHPPYRRAAAIVVIAVAMAALFVTSYVDALGRPTARSIPVAVVGPVQGPATAFLEALETVTRQGLVVQAAASRTAGEALVERQEAFAVVASPPGQPVALEISTASGSSVARVLAGAYPLAAQQAGVQVTLSDLHPLPLTDPSGLGIFYLVIGATILGFLTTFQLRANAGPLPLVPWLAFTGAMVGLGSLALITLVAHVLGVVPLPLPESWGLLALQMATASTFAASMSVLIGKWALLPTWLLFVVLGNTSSGGAVAPALLPQPFAVLSRVLPSGATVSALRSAAYFPQAQRTEPVLVLAGWALACLALLVVTCLARGRSPGED